VKNRRTSFVPPVRDRAVVTRAAAADRAVDRPVVRTVDLTRVDPVEIADAGLGFLRINRARLAILASTICILTLTVHDLPAAVAVEAVPVEVVGSQTMTTGTAAAPTASVDTFEVVAYTPVQWPLAPSTPVSSGFGLRNVCSFCSTDHQGVDFDPGGGTPIEVVADGVVVYSDAESGGLGQHVIVQHMIDGQMVQTVYGHMISGSQTVSVGDTVHIGQVLGLVGSTGASTGNHLHFEVRPGGGDAVEPLAWLAANVNQPWG
jgi:murein DD-endopeptidase MepM/ murein hydrolase activator NlpD